MKTKSIFYCLILSVVLLFSTFAYAEVTWPKYMIHLNGSGYAYLLDTSTDTVVAELKTGVGGGLGGTTPDGRKLYVGAAYGDEDKVTVIDLAKKSVIARVKTGNQPKQPLVSPNGKMVIVNHWILNNGKLRVTFMDAATDKIIKKMDLKVSDPSVTKGAVSMHNTWTSDSRYAFTMNRIDNQLIRIDTKDWSAKRFNVASKPHQAVPSPDGKELWLVLEGKDMNVRPGVVVYDLTKSNMPVITKLDMPLIGEEAIEGHHGNFTQDGKYFMMLNRGGGKTKIGRELVFFDVKSKTVARRITTASNGIGHAYNSPDGRYVVVTNYGNNVITIVDVHNLKTVKDFVLGTGRMGHVAFTQDGHYGYVSNSKDGNLFKIDMWKMEVVGEIKTGGMEGGAQVLNVWTNVFEELPR